MIDYYPGDIAGVSIGVGLVSLKQPSIRADEWVRHQRLSSLRGEPGNDDESHPI
jgi:hypothetical protein